MIRHLLVPGLFGAARQGDEDLLIPRLPRLEKILARADRQPGAVGYVQTAFALFGQAAEPGADLPTAPLCYAQETQTTPRGWWMHADPVHLRPDQDRLILFDGRMLEIGASEAEDCVAAFNAHFAGEGLQLLAAQPTRWYLKLAAPPGVVTTPLNDVTGRNVNHFLPRGERQSYWCRLLNEVQMLFHHLSVNQQREARGVAPINGLWLSGAGQFPARGQTSIRQVSAGDLLISALAANADIAGDDELMVELAPRRASQDADRQAWVDALEVLEQKVPDVACSLYPCDGESFLWRPGMRRRLWRRIRPFAAYC